MIFNLIEVPYMYSIYVISIKKGRWDSCLLEQNNNSALYSRIFNILSYYFQA